MSWALVEDKHAEARTKTAADKDFMLVLESDLDCVEKDLGAKNYLFRVVPQDMDRRMQTWSNKSYKLVADKLSISFDTQ